MFLVHPTRLSKIYAARVTHPCEYDRDDRPRSLSGHSCALFAHEQPIKMRTFEKNLPGRPYSAPCGGPQRVLLPFLRRGSCSPKSFVTHKQRRRQARISSADPRNRRLTQNIRTITEAQGPNTSFFGAFLGRVFMQGFAAA